MQLSKEDYALLQDCKLAVLEADSELSAYAASRPLEKDTALRVVQLCRQAYRRIVSRLLSE